MWQKRHGARRHGLYIMIYRIIYKYGGTAHGGTAAAHLRKREKKWNGGGAFVITYYKLQSILENRIRGGGSLKRCKCLDFRKFAKYGNGESEKEKNGTRVFFSCSNGTETKNTLHTRKEKSILNSIKSTFIMYFFILAKKRAERDKKCRYFAIWLFYILARLQLILQAVHKSTAKARANIFYLLIYLIFKHYEKERKKRERKRKEKRRKKCTSKRAK